MSGRMHGKVCLIAGTTGIAAATAELFGQEGASVVAVGNDPLATELLAASLSNSGIQHQVHTLDLTAPAAAERAHQLTLDAFGRVDVLYHVAGISGRQFGDGPLADCTDAGWDAVFATNLTAMMRLNRAALRHWLDRKSAGVILNMSSVLGFSYAVDHFQAVAYAASKAAVIAMSQHAAATYAASGIRINVIAPGLVDTPMALRAVQDQAIQDFIRHKQPLTATLSAQACAQAALYLCSDAAAAVTGIVLPVDGGWCVTG